MVGRTSEASRFNVYKFSEVLWFAKYGKNFKVDALFHFEPVQIFEYRCDMYSFLGSGYCASKGVLQLTGDEILVFFVGSLG